MISITSWIIWFILFRFRSKCISIQSVDANTENNNIKSKSKGKQVKVKSFENEPRQAWGPISENLTVPSSSNGELSSNRSNCVDDNIYDLPAYDTESSLVIIKIDFNKSGVWNLYSI